MNSNDAHPIALEKITRRRTACICTLLLVVFGVVSFSAVRTKNATIDEPTQAMSGWLELRRGDYRVETVSPPLWQMWAELPNWFAEPHLNYPSPIWKDLTWDQPGEIVWSSQVLYDTPGFDGDAFINRSRAMMLIVGVLLGAMIAYWSYQLAGPIAAITATTVFCFDPNFLGHAPLIKSDVAFSLTMLAMAFSVWRLGRRGSIGWVLAIGLLCGVAINLKFSGVIFGPLLALMLLVRAVISEPWTFLGWSLTTRLNRLFAGVAAGVVAAICCFAVTWASYGFRYRVAPSPSVRMDMQAIYAADKRVGATVELGRVPTRAEVASRPPSAVARFVQFADEHHLLPQAMLAGLLRQHSSVQMWQAFLDGERYGDGRWSYFPLATLYKTPVAALLAYLIALAVLGLAAIRQRSLRVQQMHPGGGDSSLSWTVTCLLLPVAIFGFATLTAHLNIGLRNALPIFPFIQIGVGCAAAIVWQRQPRLTRNITIILALGLAVETLHAWPDYIAFFNLTSGGERGGIDHLSDSNLDWGQDIKSLAAWQRENRIGPLYTDLYDSIDPRFYGLDSHPLSIVASQTAAMAFASDIPVGPGMVAVSVTHLQGLYTSADRTPFYEWLRSQQPIAVIGGSIYVYRFSPVEFERTMRR